MRLLKQSASLRETFQKEVEQKVFSKREIVKDKLGGGIFGAAIGTIIFDSEQFRNEIKGTWGENMISVLAASFPDTWAMFKNALIPTSTGKLTEIDILLIGPSGVFLIEVKTWSGSFSAYRDRWKRRDGSQWIPLDNSPTQQSFYHQQAFGRWITPQISSLPKDFCTAPVVFPVAKWIGTTECSVPVIHRLHGLRQFLQEKEACLTAEQVLQIAEAIEDFEVSAQFYSSKPKPILRKLVN